MPRLGELLVQQQLVSKDIVDKALRLQIGGNRRLGCILVKMGTITDDQLADTLATQLGISVCDINSNFSQEVRKIVPRYLCRQYGVLPLAVKENNILEMAMANPSDDEAISDLEHYTGKVIEPTLARYSDIEREIPRRIPLGLNDIFSPRGNVRLTRVAVAVCLCFIIIIGGFTYQYVRDAKFGTKSMTAGSTIYKNHDLMVGFDSNGKINFLGRGAYARGYYSASFSDPAIFQSFLKNRQEDLSDNQKSWLDWVVTQQGRHAPRSVAANN